MKKININIKELLNNISKYANFQPTNESEQILKECIEIFRTNTNNFSDYSKVITDGIEIKTILIEENINPLDWRTDKGEFTRSESDVLYWLNEELANFKAKVQISELLLKELELLNF